MKILITFLIVISAVFAPITDDEKIPWREGEKLTWSMFKGSSSGLGGFVASTNSGISLSFGIRTSGDEVIVDYTIQSYFYPQSSWYKKGNVSPVVLSHEQTHFDISELFARTLRKKFDAIQKDENFKENAKLIYQSNEKKRVRMQDLFDRETDHSRLSEEEIRWEKYIQEQLKLYNDWK